MQEELDIAIGYEEDEKEAELLKQKHGTANDIESNPGPPVANLAWMTKFVTMDQDIQRRLSCMLFQNITGLHEAVLEGEIPTNLYNEKTLMLINDILFMPEYFEERIWHTIKSLSIHWHEKVTEEETKERNAKKRKDPVQLSQETIVETRDEEKISATSVDRNAEGNEVEAEDSKENEKDQNSQVDQETIVVIAASSKETDDEEAEATPEKEKDSEPEATLAKNNDYERILILDEPNERKRKNTPSKDADFNENSPELEKKRPRKTQKEVKQGYHWECDDCHQGFVRRSFCNNHIKRCHRNGNAKAVERQGQEPTDTQALATQGPATDPDHHQITNEPDHHQQEIPTLPTPTEGPATDDHLPGAVVPSAQLPQEPVQIVYLDPAHLQQPQPSTSGYYEAPGFADGLNMIQLSQNNLDKDGETVEADERGDGTGRQMTCDTCKKTVGNLYSGLCFECLIA
eukprot:GFUD01060554.1.p1 GENE.GFUD01060554.1~~GFUD01060554.1.p1  ORF type:complete len:503 (+),score=137.75 GFUD01060554.1:134-1510(+)